MQILNLFEDQTENVDTNLDFVVHVGEEYIFTPLVVRDKHDEAHSLLTIYCPDEDEIKTYAIQSGDPITFLIIRSDLPPIDPRIVRVQITSNVDVWVEKYDAEQEEIVRGKSGRVVELKIKQIPNLDNYDLIGEETFVERFGRVRKPYEHGLIGYLYLDLPPQSVSEHGVISIGAEAETHTSGYDTERHSSGTRIKQSKSRSGGQKAWKRHHNAEVKRYNQRTDRSHHASKMQRAISIYKSNAALPRVQVIKLIQTQLSMSRAGASSYYTKAKHAVEDEG